MNSGRFVLSQILDLVHWQTLSRLVCKYNAESIRTLEKTSIELSGIHF